MAYHKVSKIPCWFEAIDIDQRCAKMAAINFALRGMNGRVTCGNSLTLENRFSYLIQQFVHDGRIGMIRKCDPPKDLVVEQAPVSSTVPEVLVDSPVTFQPSLFDGFE